MSEKLLSELLNDNWKKLLQSEFNKPYFLKLEEFLENEYKSKVIFPKKGLIFSALNLTAIKNIKVVILGQDPYHNNNQANGLSFSVPLGLKIPPSLKNIIKEIKNDINISEPMHGDLNCWAKQGILLLNTVLTVEAHKADSHKNKGWESFTNAVLIELNNLSQPIVFLLWGKKAAYKRPLLTNKNHLILETNHPSPLSAYRGFFGSKHFSKTNNFLIKNALKPINWEII